MKPEKESFAQQGDAAPLGNKGWAIADLGSNTFQYAAGIKEGDEILIPYRKKTGVKLGKDGMGLKKILPEAQSRAIDTLLEFREDFRRLEIPDGQVILYGTSAFRNAENCTEVMDAVNKATGFSVEVISGEREAELIFEGVAGSGALHENENQLIADIGGGSVEFILCRGKKALKKYSFEIGGLRLMEKFHTIDPMPGYRQQELKQFTSGALQLLWNELKDIRIDALVGCSGSFETLAIMDLARTGRNVAAAEEMSWLPLSADAFGSLAGELKDLPLEERLKIPGMLPLRAEMMVAAILLIEVMLEKTAARQIRMSAYSLKEGALIKKLR